MLVHGSIENGRIFYSKSGKGYAPYLAANGYDAYVLDLRGRGESRPPIGPDSTFGSRESIWEDIPAAFQFIRALRGDVPVNFVSHSWGGVLMLAFLARPTVELNIGAMVFFGTKRHISVWNLRKWFYIDIVWKRWSRMIIRKRGFLDAKAKKIGSDNESKGSFEETDFWVVSPDWRHWDEDFDFAAALQTRKLPPILYLTGKSDTVLGHIKDVRRLAEETGAQEREIMLLGKSEGNLHDYGHIDLLTHKDAVRDHFPKTLEWFRKYAH